MFIEPGDGFLQGLGAGFALFQEVVGDLDLVFLEKFIVNESVVDSVIVDLDVRKTREKVRLVFQLAAKLLETTSRVYPSGGALETSSIPAIPPPPSRTPSFSAQLAPWMMPPSS